MKYEMRCNFFQSFHYASLMFKGQKIHGLQFRFHRTEMKIINGMHYINIFMYNLSMNRRSETTLDKSPNRHVINRDYTVLFPGKINSLT